MDEEKDIEAKEGWGQRFLFKTFLPIIAPWTVQKNFGFEKKDMSAIREALSRAMAVVDLGGSVLALFFSILFAIFMVTNIWAAEKINFYTYAATISLVSMTLVGLVFLCIDSFSRKRHPVCRIVGDTVFHLALGCSLVLYFLADLKNGDLSNNDAISAALGLLFILSICQCGRWQEAAVVNAIIGTAVIAMATYGMLYYSMGSFDQYVVFVFAYLIISYVLFNAFFFVEAQRYYIENRNADLYARSTHDPLTGARNRDGLRFYLDEHLSDWKTKRENVLVAMLDIDDFKLYNDTFGHLKGDEVLVSIVHAIKSNPDIHHLRLFRYGGEEFILIRSRSNEEEATEILNVVLKIVEDLKIPAPEGASYPHLTVSLGAALWALDEGYSFSEQINAADRAVYEAKRTGKNKYVLETRIAKEKEKA